MPMAFMAALLSLTIAKSRGNTPAQISVFWDHSGGSRPTFVDYGPTALSGTQTMYTGVLMGGLSLGLAGASELDRPFGCKLRERDDTNCSILSTSFGTIPAGHDRPSWTTALPLCQEPKQCIRAF